MLLLDEKYIQEIKSILKCNNLLNKAYYFGSRVKGTYRENSDIDICLKFKISKEAINRLREYFSNSDIPFKVDVILWDAISEDFKDNIKQDLMPANFLRNKMNRDA